LDDPGEIKFLQWVKNIFNKEKDSFKKLLDEAQKNGLIRPDEYQMMVNILRLNQKTVEEILIPRTEMICAEITQNIDEVVKKVIECGHSRIPIYRNTKDQIIGIIHAKDLLKMYYLDKEHLNISSIMRTPYFVAEEKRLRELLLELRAHKIHMAIVLDEYGGTAGLVTMEDILEEIVGEIEDEYDLPKPKEIFRQTDKIYRVAGRVSLEDFNQSLGVDLRSDQVDTLGGYLSEKTGHVPQRGEEYKEGKLKFVVEQADPKYVHWIKVYVEQD